MLSLLKKELDKHSVFSISNNTHIEKLKQAIPYNISDRMKATIAVTSITTFAAQFKRNMWLWDETEVPINAIAFIISGSGKNKDSSMNAAYKVFKPGYDLIAKATKDWLDKDAIAKATEAEEELPNEESTYRKYRLPYADIITMPTTGPGLIDHINTVASMPYGANLVLSSEIGDEFAQNPDFMENIKILSEVYDTGTKAAKHTKGAEYRSKAIEGSSVNALFIGSPSYILYDEQTKRKFQIAFMSKLARRSWFCFSPDKVLLDNFSSIDDLIKNEFTQIESANNYRKSLSTYVTKVTEYHLNKKNKLIHISDQVKKMFIVYKRYNEEVSDISNSPDSTSALIRRHLQWKALKLAGALAIMDCKDTIELQHYIDAIKFAESLDYDMPTFEQELNKSYYERFSDYVKTLVTQNGIASISAHDIKKHGFLPTVNKLKLHEMIILCAGYDREGIYSIVEDGNAVEYKPIIKTDIITVSYKEINNSSLNAAILTKDPKAITEAKSYIASNSVHNFESVETSFSELSNLLLGDYAYTPFKFLNGTRDRNNIIGGTKWLVYDVDDAPISATETHFILSDINHHIALSSDPSNEYKFRLLVELDSSVELAPAVWKHFYLAVANELAIVIDPLPQSQIFFSYADRPVYSITDAEPLSVRDFVMKAIDLSSLKEPVTKATPSFKSTQLSDPENTFFYAFQAEKGSGSRSMIRAVYHAKDLGATQEQVEQLIYDINEYWSVPMEITRLENTILTQIPRIFTK